jgi:hypothetical protein
VLAVLAATLWPFNPFPRNGVGWSPVGQGLRFKRNGLVVSNAALRPPENDYQSYAVELLVRPATTRGSHTILGFYSPGRPAQFLVRQYLDGLLVTHDARFDRDPSRTIKFDADHVFSTGQLVQLTISSGGDGTTVYVDGQIAEYVPTFRISRDELSGEIIIGTSPVTHNTWSGELRGLAIYSKELTPVAALQHYKDWTEQDGSFDVDRALARYDFREGAGSEIRDEVVSGPNLEIPKMFSISHKGFLRSPVSEFSFNWKYAADVLINIVGFIPLGVIVCSCLLWNTRTRNAILLAAVSCGLLSLTIEILQYYIPPRGSGITDILTNSLGGLIGALLVGVGAIRRTLQQLRLIP